MSCCGRRTTTPGGAGRAAPRREGGRRTSGDERRERTAYLQYTGPSHLTAIGPLSGRSYHFASTGAVLAVDARDLPSLQAIPRLQRVRLGAGA